MSNDFGSKNLPPEILPPLKDEDQSIEFFLHVKGRVGEIQINVGPKKKPLIERVTPYLELFKLWNGTDKSV